MQETLKYKQSTDVESQQHVLLTTEKVNFDIAQIFPRSIFHPHILRLTGVVFSHPSPKFIDLFMYQG